MIGLHACEEHPSQEAIPPRTTATVPDIPESDEPDDPTEGEEEGDRPLIVEERLLVCLDALGCLQQLARLAQQPNNIPQFSSLFRFARVTNQFARAIAGHIRAVTAVLPLTATDLPAPDRKERV